MNQLSSLRDERTAFNANDTEIIAVSVDPAEGETGQIAFAAKLEVDFCFIPDIGRNLCLLYGTARKPYSRSWRRTMLIDKDGILRFADKNVNVFTHGPDMLTKMRELGLAQ